jgi:hypothetical protein
MPVRAVLGASTVDARIAAGIAELVHEKSAADDKEEGGRFQ